MLTVIYYQAIDRLSRNTNLGMNSAKIYNKWIIKRMQIRLNARGQIGSTTPAVI